MGVSEPGPPKVGSPGYHLLKVETRACIAEATAGKQNTDEENYDTTRRLDRKFERARHSPCSESPLLKASA